MERIITISTTRSNYDIKEAADDSITVRDLIDKLGEFEPNSKIVFKNDGGYTYGYISEHQVEEEEFEPDKEEEEPTREDYISDIKEMIKNKNGKAIECRWAYLHDSKIYVKYVEYNDSNVLGCLCEEDEFVPIDDLSDDDLDTLWFWCCKYNKPGAVGM